MYFDEISTFFGETLKRWCGPLPWCALQSKAVVFVPVVLDWNIFSLPTREHIVEVSSSEVLRLVLSEQILVQDFIHLQEPVCFT